MKKAIILIIFLLCVPVICLASTDYTINEYNVDITVNKDNNYDVIENIDVSFHKVESLIEKELPYKVSDFDVDSGYTLETKDKKKYLINNKGELDSKYKIVYTLPNNDDHTEYRVDIVNNFNSSIMKTVFNINLPSSITKENVSFLYEGEDITDKIEYKVNGNKISGTYDKGLLQGDKITLNVKYNQAYINYANSLVIIVPIILTIISYYIWKQYGKDLKVNVIKSFALPKDLTPLDIALVKNEVISEDDMFAFLIYMSNKGYIRINEEKNNEFSLERLKDYDGENYQEEVFLKSLFRKNLKVTLAEYIDIFSSKKQLEKEEALEKKVNTQEFSYKYKRVLTNLLPVFNNKEEKSVYYELESDKKKNILIAFVAIILVLITLIPFIEVNKLYLFPLSIIYGVIALKVLITAVDSINLDKKVNSNKGYMIFWSIIVTLICIVLLMFTFKRNLVYTVAFLVSFVCVIIILVLYKYMPKRTVYGSKVNAKIEGLKLFIDTCDEDNLKMAMKKNKNYLYDLLAYSYIMGNSDKVFNLLKMVDLKIPSWYSLKDDFTVVKFNNSLNRLKIVLKKAKEELN